MLQALKIADSCRAYSNNFKLSVPEKMRHFSSCHPTGTSNIKRWTNIFLHTSPAQLPEFLVPVHILEHRGIMIKWKSGLWGQWKKHLTTEKHAIADTYYIFFLIYRLYLYIQWKLTSLKSYKVTLILDFRENQHIGWISNSPDLSHCDLFLFPRHTKMLSGKKYIKSRSSFGSAIYQCL